MKPGGSTGVAQVALFGALLGASTLAGGPPAPATPRKATAARLPLAFEENRGQTDPRVRFLARGAAYSLFLTPREAVVSLAPSHGAVPEPSGQQPHHGAVLRTRFLGANRSPRLTAADEQPSRSSYFLGSNPRQWRTGVRRYGRVHYEALYPGIDLVYYGNPGNLEYDFVLQPHTDPRQIRLQLDGATSARLQSSGDLAIRVAGETARLAKPVCYQVKAGRRVAVEGRYALALGTNGRTGEWENGSARIPHTPTPPLSHTPVLGFQLAQYDPSLPLIIDPVFTYSTYLGGSADDSGEAVALDAGGNAYVTGFTDSVNFPGAAVPASGRNVFVVKLNPIGRPVYSVYLGGTLDDGGTAIAVDASGQAHVTGSTTSPDFPLFHAPFGRGGGRDGFVAKLNAGGTALLYSTYLGGSGDDTPADIAVAAGNAIVVGKTTSDTIVAASPEQPPPPGQNAFVATFSTDARLVNGKIVGGAADDEATGVAVNSGGEIFIAGTTSSDDFPTVPTAADPDPGGQDAFVMRLSANLLTMVYSRLLGGEGVDSGSRIVVDASSNALVVGTTSSTGFPQAGSRAGFLHGQTDAFVTRLNGAGTGLVFSFYLGGSDRDRGTGVALDGSGRIYVAGTTFSSDFPVANALQPVIGLLGVLPPVADAFVTQIDAGGSALLFSSYLGGSANESDACMAVSGAGDICLSGGTNSLDYPVATPLQGSPADLTAASTDGFVTRIGTATSLTAPSALTATAASASEIDLSWHDNSTTETGFEVEARSAERNAPLTFVRIATTGANVTTLAHRLLRPHAAVAYRVRAVNGSGASGYSNPAGATTLSLPTAPSNLAATAPDSDHVKLTWLDDSDNEDQFVIERRIGSGNVGQVTRIPVPANQTAFVDGAAGDKTLAELVLNYRVQAVNGLGSSAFTPTVTLSTMAAPTDLAAAATGSTIHVTWTDHTAFETGYTVERSRGNNGLFVAVANLGANATSFNDTGQTAGVLLKYRVRATNATGFSSRSNEASTTPLAAPGSVQAALTLSGMRVTWTDPNSAESGHRVQRSVNNAAFSSLASLGANATSFTDTALQTNTRYQYRVQAFSATATSDFGASNAVTTPSAPAAPTDVTAQAVSGSEIRLSWTDKSFFETEFRIERHGEGGAFTEVAAVPTNTTEYLDQGLAPAHTYTYRVRATHATGTSPYSNEASAATYGGRLQVTRKLSFGLVTRRRSRSRTLVLKNRSAAETLQVSVAAPAAPFRLPSGAASLTLAPGEKRSVAVRFMPVRAGRFHASLVVTSSDPASPRVTVRLDGTGL